jgi:outer membrane usher protein
MNKNLMSWQLMVFMVVPLAETSAQAAEDTAKKNTTAVFPYIPSILTEAAPDDQVDVAAGEAPMAQLFLSVSVNSGQTHDLLSVKQDQQQQLYIQAKDLRSIRILLDQHIADQQWVNLSQISGLSYQYQDTTQQLNLTVQLPLLQKHAINLQKQRTEDLDLLKIKPLTAAILNYQLYNSNSNGDNAFSATTNLRLNSRYGYLSSGFLYNNDQDTSYSHQDFVRLNTTWQYLDPVKVRILSVGDFVSNSADWGNSVRLAGVQWSSAYTQRADIVTTALPQFSGSAALPSTLDLYINQQRVYSGAVPSGEFDIKALPYVSGNEVTLITTDATGQQHIAKQAYYYSAKILAPQLKEFSIDVGMPRYHYATQSSDYDDVLFGSGTLRYGWNSHLTLSSAMEASSDGLINLGAGFAQRLFDRGVVNANLAGSQYDGEQGYLALLGIEGRLSRKISFNLSQQRSFDHYYDLARVSRLRYAQQYGTLEQDQYADYSPFATQISRIGLNYNFFQGFNTHLSYSKVKQADAETQYLSLSFGARLSKKWSLNTSSFMDLENSHNSSIYLTLRYTPINKVYVSSSINHHQDSNSYRQEITGLSEPKLGAFGWGVSYETSDHASDSDFASLYASYKARPAYLTARYSHYADTDQTVVSATGALVFAAGKAFVANEIGDGFAVITNAGPHSQIINGGVNLGQTDSKGRFLISRLTPYKTNHIYLDPTHLPLDWLVESTEQTAITAYRQGTQIDFGARKSLSAVLQLLDQHHVPIKAGYSVTVNGIDTAIVGYDGEVFIQNLRPNNTLEVDRLDLGKCSVEVPYTLDTSSTQKLGAFVCQ